MEEVGGSNPLVPTILEFHLLDVAAQKQAVFSSDRHWRNHATKYPGYYFA